jgi:hypothetical protein
MIALHSYQALALAFEMDAAEAALLVTLEVEPERLTPEGWPVPYIDRLRLEAAHIVCGWVDAYGPFPTIH